ncbi:hypothetical protein [Streptomyces sp. CoH17]|uniref:hypothetical protein n=1 Tax=Streptomyces sp. CoH17 TaxID=2992806 RepID=UPI002270E51A|nr:hypothetical protein [Streptomyces sp. CoH17]
MKTSLVQLWNERDEAKTELEKHVLGYDRKLWTAFQVGQEHLLTAEERKMVFEWKFEATRLRLQLRETERMVRVASGRGRPEDQLVNIANYNSPSIHVGVYWTGEFVEGIRDDTYYVVLVGSPNECDHEAFNCSHGEKHLAKDFETAVKKMQSLMPV